MVTASGGGLARVVTGAKSGAAVLAIPAAMAWLFCLLLVAASSSELLTGGCASAGRLAAWRWLVFVTSGFSLLSGMLCAAIMDPAGAAATLGAARGRSAAAPGGLAGLFWLLVAPALLLASLIGLLFATVAILA